MKPAEKRIRFRKTLYSKMIAVTVLLGVTFLGALICIYKVSSNWFKTELTNQSDTLTEQICRNIDISLKELVEDTIPLSATNERFAPLLSQMNGSGKTELPILKQRIQKRLEEMLSANYDINWVAIVDSSNNVYLVYRDSRIREERPDNQAVQELYFENLGNLSDQPGNIVWTSSPNESGIILMRNLFDQGTMKFSGSVIAEVQNASLKEIFQNIDSNKVGNYTLYDRNEELLFSTTNMVGKDGKRNFLEISQKDKNHNYLNAEYFISRSRLRISHEVDLTKKYRALSDLLYFISAMGLLLIVFIVIFLWLMFGNMARNLQILLHNIGEISKGNFDMEVTTFSKGDQMDVLSTHIHEMAGRIQNLMGEIVKAKEIQQQNEYLLLEFKYHELQAQVNPHFLFNVLQSINGIAQINGDKEVSRLICFLSKFFRGNINRTQTTCSLSMEIEYAENYLELYNNIYPDRLNIMWDVDDNLLNTMIPSCILQPIIENSLVHGMEPKIGLCTIRISVYHDKDRLIIKVWDDGQGILPEKLVSILHTHGEKKRIGIKNVQDRIQLMYGPDYGVFIESEYLHYTEVRLEFPLP
jgi:sensor histidine kinase YesM